MPLCAAQRSGIIRYATIRLLSIGLAVVALVWISRNSEVLRVISHRCPGSAPRRPKCRCLSSRAGPARTTDANCRQSSPPQSVRRRRFRIRLRTVLDTIADLGPPRVPGPQPVRSRPTAVGMDRMSSGLICEAEAQQLRGMRRTFPANRHDPQLARAPSHGRGHWFDPSIAHHYSSCFTSLWCVEGGRPALSWRAGIEGGGAFEDSRIQPQSVGHCVAGVDDIRPRHLRRYDVTGLAEPSPRYRCKYRRKKFSGWSDTDPERRRHRPREGDVPQNCRRAVRSNCW